MRHVVYYDSGSGCAALLTAGMRLGLLPRDLLPAPETVAAFLQSHMKSYAPGSVQRLGTGHDEHVYWCGLGRSATVVVRTWRHFLHLYEQPQEDYFFYCVPEPERKSWRRGVRLINQPGKREQGRTMLAQAAVGEYPVFLTVLLTEVRGR